MENLIGKRIETIRKEERLDIKEFMQILNTSKTAYYGWVNGVYFPGSDIIVTILTRFPYIRAEWLILGNGEMKKASSNSSTVAEANEVYEKPGVSKADLKNLFKKMIDEVDNL